LKIELLQTLAPEVRTDIELEWQRLSVKTEQLTAKAEQLAGENKILHELLRLLRIEKYGPKSEQLNDQQLALLELEPGVTAQEVENEVPHAAEPLPEPKSPAKPRKPHPGRAPLPAHLRRVEVLLVCPPEQCRCAACGAETKVIGHDQSEELEVQPAEYFVKVIKREKRACAQCAEGGVQAAPLPAKIVEKGKVSNRIVADVIVKKYVEHQPLYRQRANLWREAGIDLSVMTLCGYVMKGGSWLQAISRALRLELLGGHYLQADETPVGVQTAEKTGSNHRAFLWQYSRPGGPVVFDFQMSRGRDGPRQFLEKFGGVLQCDGYSAYDKIGGEGMIFAGCMAHLRRGFVEALKVDPKELRAREIVSQIGQLYHVEEQARTAGSSAAERLKMRQERSVPLLADLKQKIVVTKERALPKSALGKACFYALEQWERVSVFARDGEVEIDNNWCENAMRPAVLGRKNWLHIGSEEAGPRIAAIMSVVETCRRLGINVRDYLLDVLPRLPDWPAKRVAELTPAAWAAARKDA
jgi:transposase